MSLPVCPACRTPLVEGLDYADGGLLVRGGTLKLSRTDAGPSAVWTCRRCGQALDMGTAWAEKALAFFAADAEPRPVTGPARLRFGARAG